MTEAEVVAKVREKANGIHDPCGLAQGTAIGLADMGLIRRLTASCMSDGRWKVDLTLRFTSPGCFYFEYFENRLNASVADDGIDLNMIWDDQFDWSPNDMAETARKRLHSTGLLPAGIFNERT